MMRFAPDTRNDWFTSMFEPFSSSSNGLMKTDIRETEGKYFLDINLPGFAKEDIKVSLFNGTLTVAADHTSATEEKAENGKVIRKERFSGSCKRSWYVGENIKDSDITAAYENGVLTIGVPSEVKKDEPQEKQITIL